ncbi:MAG: DALR anticodon-binding domain-containing protein, partial [Planctomycetota bacterium]
LAKNTTEPNILCNYIFAVLKIFNNFYQQVKIITEDKEEATTLLYPVSLLAEVIKEYISILGLEEIEVM